jgi:hypothetical protein
VGAADPSSRRSIEHVEASVHSFSQLPPAQGDDRAGLFAGRRDHVPGRKKVVVGTTTLHTIEWINPDQWSLLVMSEYGMVSRYMVVQKTQLMQLTK